MLRQVFTGRRPFSEFKTPVIISKIINGERPARPQEAKELGLTDSVWEMTALSWHQDPAQRPTMAEVIRPLRDLAMSSMEADLADFFQACKTGDKGDQREKAQEFADMLDEVRHIQRHNIRSSDHISRFSKTWMFTNENVNNF